MANDSLTPETLHADDVNALIRAYQLRDGDYLPFREESVACLFELLSARAKIAELERKIEVKNATIENDRQDMLKLESQQPPPTRALPTTAAIERVIEYSHICKQQCDCCEPLLYAIGALEVRANRQPAPPNAIQFAQARAIIAELSRSNPKHVYGGIEHDPCGAHAWLERNKIGAPPVEPAECCDAVHRHAFGKWEPDCEACQHEGRTPVETVAVREMECGQCDSGRACENQHGICTRSGGRPHTETGASQPVKKCFFMVTNGRDKEIDAIGFCVEAFKDLQGHEIKRVLEYLSDWYTLRADTSGDVHE